MTLVGVDQALLDSIETETAELLSRLIQIDTSNPPGNETAVAEFVAHWFRDHGLQGEVVGEPADRRSFVLRLVGARPGPTLLFLTHEDVVPATSGDWSVPPFSGLIRDGYVWGRGATDTKNLVAANAVAVRRLAAAGCPFAGTVIYASTADEERCQGGGIRWLLDHRPDLIRADYVLNEGDSAFMPRGEQRVFMLQSGEKGTAQFRLRVFGRAGHGSLPPRHDNAVLAAARIIAALESYERQALVEEQSRDLVALLVDDPRMRDDLREPSRAAAALFRLAQEHPDLADMIEPLYGFAFSPTVVECNSSSVNVVPSEVVISVDCRMLADHHEGEVEAAVSAALEGVDAVWQLEWINVIRGNSSPYPTRLSEAIGSVLCRHVPGAVLGHDHCVGFTDANWIRAAWPDVIAYDAAPFAVESYGDVIQRAHNVDERIHVRDLAVQAFFAEQVALELLRPSP